MNRNGQRGDVRNGIDNANGEGVRPVGASAAAPVPARRSERDERSSETREPREREEAWEERRSRAFEGAADYGYASRSRADRAAFEARQRWEREHGYRSEHPRYGSRNVVGLEPGWEHDRYGEGPWRGRDEEHDFWGRERHSHRGIGERLGGILGREHTERPEVEPRRYGDRTLWDRVRGVFTGLGPKNYIRSDERIREDVCERLCYHPYVDARDIEVSVLDGEVTLTGTVDDRSSKRLAEDVVDDVRGVKDVHNQLRVEPQFGPGSSSGARR